MATISDMFNTYVKYFPTIDKTIKLIRGGKIKVTDNKLNKETIYNSWDELNSEYQQVDGYINEPPKQEPKQEEPKKKVEIFKVWTYGDPENSDELRQAMSDKYFEFCGKRLTFKELSFKKPNWIYMLGAAESNRPNGVYIETCNDVVKFILENSEDWEQLKVPVKLFTKADIAKLIGMSVDKFEII